MSKVKITSSTVIGEPSWKRACVGDEAVLGRGLVHCAGHQRVVGEADEPGRRALERVGIEAVEGARAAKPHPPALRRLRVDVGEMRKVRRILQAVEERQPVPPGEFAARLRRRRPDRRNRSQRRHGRGGGERLEQRTAVEQRGRKDHGRSSGLAGDNLGNGRANENTAL